MLVHHRRTNELNKLIEKYEKASEKYNKSLRNGIDDRGINKKNFQNLGITNISSKFTILLEWKMDDEYQIKRLSPISSQGI